MSVSCRSGRVKGMCTGWDEQRQLSSTAAPVLRRERDNPPFEQFLEHHPPQCFLEILVYEPLEPNARTRVHQTHITSSHHAWRQRRRTQERERERETSYLQSRTTKMAPLKETMAMVAAALWLASVDSFLTPVPVGTSRAGNRALAYKRSAATEGIQARPQQHNAARRHASMSAAPGKVSSSG